MPIEHACSCGAKLKVKDELEGRKVKCPKCSRVSTVAAVTTKPEMISVQCRCGKHYQAKMSMSGKTFQCTSCQESVSIPNLNRTTVEDDQDPFAANVSTSDSAGFFDGNLPDLAIPSAPYVPYQPPVKATTTKEVRAAKPAGFNVQFAQDTLVIVTSILCILFGLSRLVFLNPLFIILNPSVLLSFGGILYLANILVCFGILVAGIGLLLQQEWSIGAGQIAASMFFVLVLINLVMFLGSMAMLVDGKTGVLSLARSVFLFVTETTASAVGPGLLLYLTSRDN